MRFSTRARTMISYDRSLYSRRPVNRETRAAIDGVNAEARRVLPPDVFNRQWGSQTTLRRKMEFLETWKAEHGA